MPKAAQYYPDENEFAEDKGVSLDIYQCSFCGLIQLSMKPVNYFKEVITAATLSGKSRQSRLQQIQKLVNAFGLKGKKVLDVGSGKGELLDVLIEAGLEATGIEASPSSVEIGRIAGRNIINGYIGDITTLNCGPYDAFVCLNYLEHLPKPGEIIRNIYNNTTSGAVGFVTVPNVEYLLRTKCFYEFVADHLSYFTSKTLTHAFEINGFDVLECSLINEENDIAVTVKKKAKLDISEQYSEVDALIRDMQNIIANYTNQNKKVAVWGAGHRTLALLALSRLHNIEYIVDSAKFKHGKYSPVMHSRIVSPEHLKENKVDLVIVMVPGLYPSEVFKTMKEMDIGVEVAALRDNKIEFIEYIN